MTYFQISNLAGQIIVILLALSSIIAWTIMSFKMTMLRRIQRNSELRFREIMDSGDLLALPVHAHEQNDHSFADIAVEALTAYKREIHEFGHPSSTVARERCLRAVENAMTRSISETTLFYEWAMVTLASIVTAAPFLGLLGTVWGVMESFLSVSAGGGASIQTLAPGVSGALLTTVCALLVAIPSVIGYNALISKIKVMGIQLENFASQLSEMIETELSRQEAPPSR